MSMRVDSLWHSVQRLSPTRLPGVHYQDRMVRREPWTFVHNDVTGKHVRVNGLARRLLQSLDGEATVSTLIDKLAPAADDEQREMLAQNLLQLEQHGMISFNDPARDAPLRQQAQKLTRSRARPWQNPLAIRIPLLNSDPLLNRLAGGCQRVPGRLLLRVTLVLISSALLLALVNRQELADQLRHMSRTPDQWWQMLVLYPVLKCVHELAHALVLKHFGGTVHETGLTILVLMPVPYVDASDTWRLNSRRQRILVSTAGMLAEGFLAALGLLTWFLVEPGLARDLGFSLALTGSVSTLLFNANPLMKFDGYQVLQDYLDMPNLAPRAARYLRYLARRYLLGVQSACSPVSAQGERRWLLAYGVGAAIYRWVLMLGIALYLASRFPLFGSVLAMFALYQLAVKPLTQAIRYLARAPELNQHRHRAVSVAGSLTGAILCLAFLLPIPTHTRAQGVVVVPSQARLYTPISGEITEIHVSDGQWVAAGQRIVTLESPTLQAQRTIANSERDVLSLRYHAAQLADAAFASGLFQDLQSKQRTLDELERQVEQLQVRAGTSGTVSLDSALARPGQYVSAGSLLGHVIDAAELHVQAVVRQSNISRVEAGVKSVQVRLGQRFAEPLNGTLLRQTPSGSRILPSQVLAGTGLGGIAVASTQDNEWETVEPVFHVELELPPDVEAAGIGGRAYITLAHQAEPVGSRTWRALRQLLLDQLAL